MAISYVMSGEDYQAQEVFSLPSGWGVLRSKCGLLLWLKLFGDELLGAAVAMTSNVDFSASQVFWGKKLCIELRSEVAGKVDQLNIWAVASSQCISKVLSADEGLLHPSLEMSGTHAHLMLDHELGPLAKRWLAELSRQGSGGSVCKRLGL